jgi:hypothetical protein
MKRGGSGNPMKEAVVFIGILLVMGALIAFTNDIEEDEKSSGTNGSEEPAPISDQMSIFSKLRDDEDSELLYRFDGDSEDSVIDETGIHNGIIQSDPERVPGIFGQALLFDGSDDHVDTTYEPHFEPAGEFTIELWFRTSNSEGQNAMYLFGVKTSTGDGLPLLKAALWERDNTNYPGLVVEFTDNSDRRVTLEVNRAFDDGEWHYFALVRTLNYFELYIDFNLVGSTLDICNDKTDITDPIFIGALHNDEWNTYFNGAIDEFRISDIAREIRTDMSFRVTGTPGNRLYFMITQGDTSADFEITSGAGNPQLGVLAVDLDYSKDISLHVRFEAPDGKGSNPVWVISDDHKERIITFNAKKNDKATWKQDIDLTLSLS